ncbi:MAG: PTS sugar transporter subunit IIB [Erysipelotrichaceae bacterium]|nr:PTS sugar transporter subunit IIB [Erysipelotrichaceae bacterium]
MADKTIILFCGAGMSTSLLVNKMKEVAASQGKDYEIHAHALTEEAKYAPTADVILIGPQVRFELENMRKRNPGIKITDIPMRTYGLMDGKGALEIAEKLMFGE